MGRVLWGTDMAKDIKSIADLTPDPRNANKGTERGYRVLDDSIRDLGAGRSIVTDKEGRVIAGNKTLEAVVDAGLPIRTIQTDGTELVVVQRTDLDLENGDDKARRLAYADNRAGELGLEWDAGQIADDMDAGLDFSGLFEDFELEALTGTCVKDEDDRSAGESNGAAKTVKCPVCDHEFSP